MDEKNILSQYIKAWLREVDGRSLRDLATSSGIPYTTVRTASMSSKGVTSRVALKLLLVVAPLEKVMAYFEEFAPELNDYCMLVAAKQSKSLSSIEALDSSDCAILSWMICLEFEREIGLLSYFGSSAGKTIEKLIRLGLLIRDGEMIKTPAANLHLSDPIVHDLSRYFQKKINLEIALHSNRVIIGGYTKENANKLYLKAAEHHAELRALANSMRDEKGDYKLAIITSTILL
ncbi:MAG: hypothetical protein EOP48_06050 [Sphingobacteriales bacterium]|nr:MAG: hypothetical protein EOP48_06050 [Sphingobacteriales bacterium]